MVNVNMNEDCQWLKDISRNSLDVNFCGTNKGLYNLMICIGQVKLFSKGIKPTRKWRLKDVKKYFGIKGNTESILAQLETLNDIIKEEEGND